jgi:hypothetical protein
MKRRNDLYRSVYFLCVRDMPVRYDESRWGKMKITSDQQNRIDARLALNRFLTAWEEEFSLASTEQALILSQEVTTLLKELHFEI